MGSENSSPKDRMFHQTGGSRWSGKYPGNEIMGKGFPGDPLSSLEDMRNDRDIWREDSRHYDRMFSRESNQNFEGPKMEVKNEETAHATEKTKQSTEKTKQPPNFESEEYQKAEEPSAWDPYTKTAALTGVASGVNAVITVATSYPSNYLATKATCDAKYEYEQKIRELDLKHQEKLHEMQRNFRS